MGHYLEAACKRKFWSRYLGNNSSARPSIINVIELLVSMPSLLRAHPLIDTVS
jgi:hypothetical protein